jgi:hypothetical protein
MSAMTDNHDYERKDVDVRALFIVACVLLLSCIAIFTAVAVMMHYFKVHEPAVTAGQANIPVTRVRDFPQPRLLIKPGASLVELRAAEDADLNSYGWFDRTTGIARIPIGRAMELLLENGLPDVGAGQTPLSLMQARPSETGSPPRLQMPKQR